MKIYSMPRGSGKTYQLAKKSHESGMPVIVTCYHAKKYFNYLSKYHGFTNAVCFTLYGLIKGEGRGYKGLKNGVLVDEANHVLSNLIGAKVCGMSFTEND